MSTNFYLHAAVCAESRSSLLAKVLNSFTGRYHVEGVCLHPPYALFRQRTAVYPRTYRVAIASALCFDPDVIGRQDTALVGKVGGVSQGTVDIPADRMAAYVDCWSDPFSIDFVIEDKVSLEHVSWLGLNLNKSDLADINVSLIGPTLRDRDVFKFIDTVSNVFDAAGFERAVVSLESTAESTDWAAATIRKAGAPNFDGISLVDPISFGSGDLTISVSRAFSA